MEEKRRVKLNNVGMSLIEIVVVVLILGILSAGAVYGFSYIRKMNASSSAEEIMMLLERTRLNVLAAEEETNPDDSVRLQLTKEGSQYYGTILKGSGASVTIIDKVEIGSEGISIKVTGSGTDITVSDTESAVFYYEKSNGAFRSDHTKIEVTGTKMVPITLVKGTGRCYMGN
ncbi:MAG: prepilin-type N-terminal cleavage/methylation domain-containing protein [Lachnospiraceae bacterium]|nr:prepilin-type N-terminal cleavage/methylation domain-containing protein [Lachnospiraceae bacterium]